MAIIVARPGGNIDPICRGIIFLVLETPQPIPVVALRRPFRYKVRIGDA